MYASAVCSGKVTPKNKSQKRKERSNYEQGGIAKGCGGCNGKQKKSYQKILI
jgi:hypothetical protein